MAKSNAERQAAWRKRQTIDQALLIGSRKREERLRKLVQGLRAKLDFYEKRDSDGYLSREYDDLMADDVE